MEQIVFILTRLMVLGSLLAIMYVIATIKNDATDPPDFW
jgi:hypothetical protein